MFKLFSRFFTPKSVAKSPVQFSDEKVIIFNLETDSKEQFESQIGMTIEKLLSYN